MLRVPVKHEIVKSNSRKKQAVYSRSVRVEIVERVRRRQVKRARRRGRTAERSTKRQVSALHCLCVVQRSALYYYIILNRRVLRFDIQGLAVLNTSTKYQIPVIVIVKYSR